MGHVLHEREGAEHESHAQMGVFFMFGGRELQVDRKINK